MFAAALLILSTGALDFVASAKADLDGDGKEETIAVEASTLTIDTKKLGTKLQTSEALRFAIIDLDQSDKKREVLVVAPEANDLADYLVLAWSDKKIVELGRFGGQIPSEPELSGGGFLTYGAWEGFYTRRVKLVLDAKKQKLAELIPELYAVDVSVKVKESFPLYTTRARKDVLARVKAGSEVTIVACGASKAGAACDLFLVRSSTGLLGFVSFAELEKGAELPLAG